MIDCLQLSHLTPLSCTSALYLDNPIERDGWLPFLSLVEESDHTSPCSSWGPSPVLTPCSQQHLWDGLLSLTMLKRLFLPFQDLRSVEKKYNLSSRCVCVEAIIKTQHRKLFWMETALAFEEGLQQFVHHVGCLDSDCYHSEPFFSIWTHHYIAKWWQVGTWSCCLLLSCAILLVF